MYNSIQRERERVSERERKTPIPLSEIKGRRSEFYSGHFITTAQLAKNKVFKKIPPRTSHVGTYRDDCRGSTVSSDVLASPIRTFEPRPL